MRSAVLPAAFAWIVGVVAVIIVAGWIDYSDAHERGDAWLNGNSLGGFVSAMGIYLAAYTVAVAVVVFSTCLLIVVPVLRFVPRSWPVWWPINAALIGAVIGPMAMYIWSAAFRVEFFVPDLSDYSQMGFAATAALVGMTFGFLYAKSIRTARL